MPFNEMTFTCVTISYYNIHLARFLCFLWCIRKIKVNLHMGQILILMDEWRHKQTKIGMSSQWKEEKKLSKITVKWEFVPMNNIVFFFGKLIPLCLRLVEKSKITYKVLIHRDCHASKPFFLIKTSLKFHDEKKKRPLFKSRIFFSSKNEVSFSVRIWRKKRQLLEKKSWFSQKLMAAMKNWIEENKKLSL